MIMVLFVFCLNLAVFNDTAGAENLSCARCGKPITHNYIKSVDFSFHPQCFTCMLCGKPLKDAIVQDGKDMYHPDCHSKAKNLVCEVCGKPLAETWVDVDGKKYHSECYKKNIQIRCGICGKPIEGDYVRDNGVYHESCYKEHKLERCVVCSRPLDGRHIVDAWGNKAHERHGSEDSLQCGSCGRIIAKKSSGGGSRYHDGRLICGICSRTAVHNLDHLKKVSDEIFSLFSSVGIMGIPRGIPVTLVDKDGLKKQSGVGYNESARGFTLSLSKRQNTKTLSRDHTIFILEGLPLLEFKGILAHEYLHVWLSENEIHPSAQATEGFCNLGIMLVNTNDSSALARVLQTELENNPDPIYGKGYRAIKKKLDQKGWEGLIRSFRSSR